ncbi:hypothetical protein JCM21714_3119 [Gracilibacillus boraciitolerans JCM 21714]|uniref:DUF1450 domain-containing protein n=1 Tax=Gracilibacillus boraciitolerans JCM 21714 TaxID=1298598 RepID=W4VMM6_9BACI|nr:hypothetical protein JCM21714_3119 [Gracilibacillus boraciitolerans JCM 21714]
MKNLANGSEEARKELLKDPDLDVVEYGCTSYCGICRRYHVAIVNGKLLQLKPPRRIINKY